VWQGKLPSHIFTWLIALEEKVKPEHAICAWIPNQTVDNREFETDPARIRSYSVGPLCDLSLLGRLLTGLGSQRSLPENTPLERNARTPRVVPWYKVLESRINTCQSR